MRKLVSLATVSTSIVILITILIPAALATDGPGWVGYPGPDMYSRCIHNGNFNTPGDTWTATGLTAYYAYNQAAYVHGNYDFQRGCGGQGQETYRTTGNMGCFYNYGTTNNYQSVAGTPVRENRYIPGYGYVDAWYHLTTIFLGTFSPAQQPSISGGAGSYFYDPQHPSDPAWYINSFIEASHMTAGW